MRKKTSVLQTSKKLEPLEISDSNPFESIYDMEKIGENLEHLMRNGSSEVQRKVESFIERRQEEEERRREEQVERDDMEIDD